MWFILRNRKHLVKILFKHYGTYKGLNVNSLGTISDFKLVL